MLKVEGFFLRNFVLQEERKQKFHFYCMTAGWIIKCKVSSADRNRGMRKIHTFLSETVFSTSNLVNNKA